MQEENKMEETNGEFSQKKLQIQQQQLQQVQQQQQTNLNSPNTLNEYYGLILGNKYRIENKIGSGSFGEIYHAINLRTNEDVAVKIEKKSQHRKKQENSINPEQGVNSFYQENRHSQVKREAKIYSMLHGEPGIPKIRWFGLGTEKNWLVMDLLGRSLEDLFNFCNRKFTLKTVLVLAYELMCRIEVIHSKGKLIHRDIKPENFLMGRGRDRHTVYVIDFGLAKLYQNPHTGRHIPFKQGYSLTGTARYASVNAHLGYELSRRDDLISIGYVLVYFIKGILPWQGLHGKNNEEKYKLILEKKASTPLEDLCSELPPEFLHYFRTVTSLGFEQVPDYNLLKNIFKQLFVQNKYTYDNILYDWEVLAYQRKK